MLNGRPFIAQVKVFHCAMNILSLSVEFVVIALFFGVH
jgi:hypothetical protein